MSRTKELKTSPENNLSLFDLFSLFCPDRKTKYTETLLRIMKLTPNIDEHAREVKESLRVEFNISDEQLNEFSPIQIALFYRIVDSMFNFKDLQTFQKFCEYNERGLIKQNDVSKYNNFDQIISAVSLAEIAADSKDLEKQVKVVFESDEWLLIRPLTYQSSKKYGANTKWCTTTENNPEYFIKYASKGVLIYCINKQTGYKVASFYSLDKRDPEFSFWNQKDTRVDSLDTELTRDLREIIFDESKEKGAKPNRSLLSEDEKIKEEKSLSKHGLNYRSYEIPVNTVAEERIDYLNRALRRADEYDVTEITEEAISENDSQEDMTESSPNLDQVISDVLSSNDLNTYMETSRLVDIMRSMDNLRSNDGPNGLSNEEDTTTTWR